MMVHEISYALESLGYKLSPHEEVCKTIGLSLPETFKALTGNCRLSDADSFRRYFKEKADQVMAEGTMLFDGVKQLVNHIENKGLKCGIVSTKFRYRIEEILNRDGFAGRFNIIIGGEDVSNNKPDPEGLLKTIDILKINKRDYLYIFGEVFCDYY